MNDAGILTALKDNNGRQLTSSAIWKLFCSTRLFLTKLHNCLC